MKGLGVLLILVAIIILAGYGFYEILLTVDIPLWVKVGLILLAAGLSLALIALIQERINDKKREGEEDDFS